MGQGTGIQGGLRCAGRRVRPCRCFDQGTGRFRTDAGAGGAVHGDHAGGHCQAGKRQGDAVDTHPGTVREGDRHTVADRVRIGKGGSGLSSRQRGDPACAIGSDVRESRFARSVQQATIRPVVEVGFTIYRPLILLFNFEPKGTFATGLLKRDDNPVLIR